MAIEESEGACNGCVVQPASVVRSQDTLIVGYVHLERPFKSVMS